MLFIWTSHSESGPRCNIITHAWPGSEVDRIATLNNGRIIIRMNMFLLDYRSYLATRRLALGALNSYGYRVVKAL
jgi:hypothetical protein